MLARKKSILLCFVIGALLCTLISCGNPNSTSADEATTVASAEGVSETEAEIQDIRKTSLEENTREIVKATIKSTESDEQESSSEAVAARIAGASVKRGAADYETAAQNEEAVQSNVPPAGETAETVAEQETPVAPELENMVVTTVVDTYQNIRLEPSEDSEVIGRLYEGSAGEVLETRDGWTKISSGDVEGWVHNEYVVSGEAAQSFAEEALEQVATIKEDGVRVRAGASVDSTWIGVVNVNETYKVVMEEPEDADEEAEPESEAAAPEGTPAEETKPEEIKPEETEPETEAVAEQPAEPQTAALQSTDGQVVPEETKAEPEWIKIIYDDDQEGYVCADYVTLSFKLGKAKSMEEIRAEEEAAAKAAAEKAAAERAEKAKEAAKSEEASSGWVSLGEFKITAYCGGACCNGQWAGTTSSGATPTEGRTIAVAPGLIPYGTRVKIGGIDGVYVAEDTGGFANSNSHQIDIYFANHSSATSWGVSYREVWVKR
ncbi:MAG: SH3 domain-containing protein [Lachnospiraceae bacterium]|nr:SH3 domain-containing protein [Lachnospiraceae bacterium]